MTREEATTMLKKLRTFHNGTYAKALDMAIEALSVPVVDITQRDLCADISCTDCPFMKETCKLMDCVAYADRPHGVWNDDCACSVCGCQPWYEHDIHTLNFCPNCGADMRKENKQL